MIKGKRIYIAGSGGMLGEAFYKIFNIENILRCTDKDVNDNWLEFLDFRNIGLNVDNWILSSYRKTSFYTMRTDSRDRFGTPLEKRFTRSEIKKMMQDAGLDDIQFSNRFPFWCAVGKKN